MSDLLLVPPTDPSPRTAPVEIAVPGGAPVEAVDDRYSDRLRCDHPDVDDGAAFGEALLLAAETHHRPRVVVLTSDHIATGLEQVGLVCEGIMPGFYRGEHDCVVMGYCSDPDRDQLAFPQQVAAVDALLREDRSATDHPPTTTRRARREDSPAIAELIAETFPHYPTPSGVPEYIENLIGDGVPFRVVEAAGEVIAVASADLVRPARTAELTDCATRPDCRGRGLMQFVLADLMHDLVAMGYPTAFTLARARIPGVNLAFQRLGFHWRGRMPQSCRIGSGLEDMNILSRTLAGEDFGLSADHHHIAAPGRAQSFVASPIG